MHEGWDSGGICARGWSSDNKVGVRANCVCATHHFFVNALTSVVVTERVPINTNISLRLWLRLWLRMHEAWCQLG